MKQELLFLQKTHLSWQKLVNELLSDKEKAQKLATNGNTFVKNNMTWDVILPKYIKFYENLLKN